MLVIDQSEYIEDRPVPGPFPDFPMTKRESPGNEVDVPQFEHSGTVLPFARKFPCKRKFWYLKGKMQGNKIDKEIARKSSLKQGN